MNFKSSKAITLVALIITIIILLILAGVSLSMVLGDNGLINNAQSSVDKYQESANKEQDFLNAIEEYIDLKAEKIVTAKEIASNPKKYYGARVTNYDKGAAYRIFYVDTAGKYGDGNNTVYLIADYDENRKQTLGWLSADGLSYTVKQYNKNDTKIREMNKEWAINRGSIDESNWNLNEKAVAYLCDTSKWTDYYDDTKANYAIGSPSWEMYADSYNQTHGVDKLVYRYQTTNVPGYGVGENGIFNGNGWCTGEWAIDDAQNSIYLTEPYFWIASPHSYAKFQVMLAICRNGMRYVNSTALNWGCPVRPIVSLKSDFIIKIEI